MLLIRVNYSLIIVTNIELPSTYDNKNEETKSHESQFTNAVDL